MFYSSEQASFKVFYFDFYNTPFNISFLTIFYLLEAIIAILTQ